MSNKEILEKAIQKAIEGGWKVDYDKDFILAEMQEGQFGHDIYNIFNHDFAKTLWGEEEDFRLQPSLYSGGNGGYYGVEFDGKAWEFHLMEMVISEDPIKYLGDNI